MSKSSKKNEFLHNVRIEIEKLMIPNLFFYKDRLVTTLMNGNLSLKALYLCRD